MKFLGSFFFFVVVIVSASAIVYSGVRSSVDQEILKDTNLDARPSRLTRRHATMTEHSKMRAHPSERRKRSADGTPLYKRQATCGRVIGSEEEAITSPNYPEDYPANLDCQWTIEAPPGKNIQLIFDDFRIEIPRSHNNVCEFDGLEIRAESNTSEPVAVVCGKTKPSPITVLSNKVFLRMFSDDSLGFLGFNLHAHFVASDETDNLDESCNATLTSPEGVISSPNYPQEYPSNLDCSWTIEAPEGNSIELTFADFELEGGATCEYDALTLIDGETDDILCGEDNPGSYVSNSNVVYLRMTSDGSVNENGFSLSYRFVEVDQVTTASPSPTEWQHVLSISGGTCTYTVEASPGCVGHSVGFVQKK